MAAITYSKSNKSFVTVGVGIIHQNGKYLICQRSTSGSLPLYWEFPGGKQEKDERIQDTIVRELLEELNVKANIEHKLGVYQWQYPLVSVRLICYFVTIKDISMIHLNVHADMKWCSLHDLTKYNILPSNKQIIETLKVQHTNLIK